MYEEIQISIGSSTSEFEIVGQISGDCAGKFDFDVGPAWIVPGPTFEFLLSRDLPNRNWRLYGGFHGAGFYVFYLDQRSVIGVIHPRVQRAFS